MVIVYKKWKKYNEIQLMKNKMDLNNQKMTNHPPSPVTYLQLVNWHVHPKFVIFTIFYKNWLFHCHHEWKSISLQTEKNYVSTIKIEPMECFFFIWTYIGLLRRNWQTQQCWLNIVLPQQCSRWHNLCKI